MRKILKTMLSAVIFCVTAAVVTLCAYAETEDVEMKIVVAKTTNGAWGQSLTYDKSAFDWTRITPDSEIKVEFELDGEWSSGYPVELIFHNYTTADPAVWAKIPPYEYDETSASFRYEDMVAMYGSDDFSTVDAVHLGDCGIVMKATKFTVTNCTVAEVTTTAETTTTEAVTETTAEAATTAAAEAITTAPADSGSSESGKIPLIPIVIGAVAVAVVVVVIIIVSRSKRRFY